jgi:hypothetical protein
MNQVKIYFVNLFIFFCLSLIILFSASCDRSIGPEIGRDPRLYSWTIDTIMYTDSYQTMMKSLWGSSSKDVYAVGHNDRVYGKIYHYDGNGWNEVKLLGNPNNPITSGFDFSAITGFNSNDIWAVGNRYYINYNPPPNFLSYNFILHYDGNIWNEIKLEGGDFLNQIWGSSSSNIFTGGGPGFIWHYDGANWSKDSFPVNVTPLMIQSISGTSSGDIYANAIYSDDNLETHYIKEIFYFFRYRDHKWSFLDTAFSDSYSAEIKWGYNCLWSSPEGNLYSAGVGIYIWKGDQWQKIFETLPYSVRYIFGTSDNNIFAVGDWGVVYHYNGIDWYQFTQFQSKNISYQGIWANSTDVFITGYTNSSPNKTVILHGR